MKIDCNISSNQYFHFKGEIKLIESIEIQLVYSTHLMLAIASTSM